jgi:hypothetical protein
MALTGLRCKRLERRKIIRTMIRIRRIPRMAKNIGRGIPLHFH